MRSGQVLMCDRHALLCTQSQLGENVSVFWFYQKITTHLFECIYG